jgi:hypothetical protein
VLLEIDCISSSVIPNSSARARSGVAQGAGIADILQRLDFAIAVAAPFVSDAGFSAAARIVLYTAD